MKRKAAVAISSAVEEWLSTARLPSVGLLARLVKAWPDAVGFFLAEKTFPTKLRRAVLTVTVQSHPMAQELQFAKPVFLRNIAALAGEEAVRDIRFVVGTIPAPDAAPPPRRQVPGSSSGPLPEPEGLDGIPDQETRVILRSLARKALTRRG